MHIAVLGTGGVGRTLGRALIDAGEEVTLGSRAADTPEAVAWAASCGERARVATFADAVAAAALVVNATAGMATLDVLASCAPSDLAGKVLIDVSNPLDFSAGFPPTLSVCNTDSLAEQVQRAHPEALVVKALNTMAAEVMVAPGEVPGQHAAPIAGDDATAKATVTDLLVRLGWRVEQVLDLGGIDAARGMEMWLPLWLRLYGAVGHPMFNLAVQTATHAPPPG